MSYKIEIHPSPYRRSVLVHDDLNDELAESEQRLFWEYEERIPVDGRGAVDQRQVTRRRHRTVLKPWVNIKLAVNTRYMSGELIDMDVDIYMNTPTENGFLQYLGIKTDAYNIMRHFEKRGNEMVCDYADLGRFGRLEKGTGSIALPCANLPMQFVIPCDWDPLDANTVPCVVRMPQLPGIPKGQQDVHFPTIIHGRLSTQDTETIEGGPQLLLEDKDIGE